VTSGRFCRYHCRACGSCFVSLEAFDAHRTGPMADRRCEFPEAVEWIERQGECRISEYDEEGHPAHRRKTVYATARGQDISARLRSGRSAGAPESRGGVPEYPGRKLPRKLERALHAPLAPTGGRQLRFGEETDQ
jgi:hypothetical protein